MTSRRGVTSTRAWTRWRWPNSIVERYTRSGASSPAPSPSSRAKRWRVQARIERLNELGFDVGELSISTDVGGSVVQIQPKVVGRGHHSRRLLRLTGIDAENNQARRLLNDLDGYIAASDRQNDQEEIVAHEWLARVFEPVVKAVPRELRRKLEPAEIFHEVLEHRWYRSRSASATSRCWRPPAGTSRTCWPAPRTSRRSSCRRG